MLKTINKRPTFAKFKEKSLQNPNVKREYDLLAPEFEILEKFIKARKKTKKPKIKI